MQQALAVTRPVGIRAPLAPRRGRSVTVRAMYDPADGKRRTTGSTTTGERPVRAVGSPGVESWNDNVQQDPDVQRTVDNIRSVFEDAQARWERNDDKKTTVALIAGAVAGTFLFSWILSALNRLPLLPDLFTFIGFVATTNFFWRFILFKTGRDRLRDDASELYGKIRDNFEGDRAPAREYVPESVREGARKVDREMPDSLREPARKLDREL